MKDAQIKRKYTPKRFKTDILGNTLELRLDVHSKITHRRNGIRQSQQVRFRMRKKKSFYLLIKYILLSHLDET